MTLLEKNSRLGGCIQTVVQDGSLMEIGPRTFAFSRSNSLLRLIEEVGLKEEIIVSDPSASKRYLWHHGRLRSMSSFFPMLIPGLIRECFVPKKDCGDESIYEYAKRRLNTKIADTLFDPMTLGIYAGDIRELSLRACFPFLYDLEQKGCSLLRALFCGKKDHRLMSLKRGIGSLIDAMEQKLHLNVIINCPVEAILQNGVMANGSFWTADKIICALPGSVVGRLTNTVVKSQSIWVVNIGFKTKILQKEGFGYLIPSKEKEAVMGMVWDSSIFKRDPGLYQTVLTCMVRNGGDQAWAESEAQRALVQHLGCRQSPDLINGSLALEAIPQFTVGYSLKQMRSLLQEQFPHITWVGNYLGGASVDACIRFTSEQLGG